MAEPVEVLFDSKSSATLIEAALLTRLVSLPSADLDKVSKATVFYLGVRGRQKRVKAGAWEVTRA